MGMHTYLDYKEEIDYPETDGKPIAESTQQFEWIVTIQGNLDAQFKDVNVFVAGDLFWYPVQGQPTIRTAPDTMMMFGRPKGHRRSYKQWQEGGIAPQVVFEVLSPSTTATEMKEKFLFFERYGVEEYYLYDPDGIDLRGWRRVRKKLRPIKNMHGWISPRLRIRFDMSGSELVIYGPDGQRFLTFTELMQQKQQAEQLTEQERRAREEERRAKEKERRAKEKERRAKEEAQQRAERLAEQLRKLGFEPEE
jgi:Uma2 family endonuclease